MSARRRSEMALSREIERNRGAIREATIVYLRAALAPFAAGLIDDAALKRAKQAFDDTAPRGRYAPR